MLVRGLVIANTNHNQLELSCTVFYFILEDQMYCKQKFPFVIKMFCVTAYKVTIELL